MRNASTYTRKKGVRALYLEARTSRRHRKSLRLFCGHNSRRLSSVSSLLLQDLKSPYVFLNFNGDFTTTETAQERSMKQLSDARARCQLWNLGSSITMVSFVAGPSMCHRGKRLRRRKPRKTGNFRIAGVVRAFICRTFFLYLDGRSVQQAVGRHKLLDLGWLVCDEAELDRPTGFAKGLVYHVIPTSKCTHTRLAAVVDGNTPWPPMTAAH